MKPLLYFLAFLFLTSCSSSKLVSEWRSPEAVNFEANKVLVIGLAQDKKVRRQFEQQLASALEKKDVIAVKSIDFFEESFMDVLKTDEEMNAIERQLTDAGFDAILFSKVIGSENKVTLSKAVRDFDETFDSFREDYYESQNTFYRDREYHAYTVYHAETNLYCICPDKDRELLWSGNIDVIESDSRERSIRNYVKTLIHLLEEKQLLIVNL